MATQPVNLLSEEEYLRLERLAETKSEYHDGELFAMAGGSPNHALLCNAIGGALRSGLPKGCRVYSADLKVKVPGVRAYVYPDCSVVCGPSELFEGDTLLNPVLLVEVLSPSSAGYDRGEKFEWYRRIPSLREYLVIHQDRRFVEHWSKQDDASWLLREYAGPEASLAINRWNVRLPLADLYEGAEGLQEVSGD